MEVFTNFGNIIERVNKNEAVFFVWYDSTRKPSLIVKDRNFDTDNSIMYFLYDFETLQKEPFVIVKDNKIKLLDGIENSILTKGMIHTMKPIILFECKLKSSYSWFGRIKLLTHHVNYEYDELYPIEVKKTLIYKSNVKKHYKHPCDMFKEMYNCDFLKKNPKLQALCYIEFIVKKRFTFETSINKNDLNL